MGITRLTGPDRRPVNSDPPASERRPRLCIAFILTPIEFGGAEKVSLTFLKNIDRSRFEVIPIILIRPWEGENYFARELKGQRYRTFEVPVATTEKRDYLRVIRCYKMVHRILKSTHFDLVHTNGYFADIIGIPVARKLGIPSISTCHGFISTDRKLRIYNKLDKRVLRFSNRIIAVSPAIREDLSHDGIAESRVVVIQNAVAGYPGRWTCGQMRSTRRVSLGFSEHDYVVGFTGRLSPEKGLRFLVQAISLLVRSAASTKLVLIGEGPEHPALRTFAEEKGLKEKVIFAGFQHDAESWLPCFDVFALPSLTEGTPMALLEAMSCGIPVVASAVGGIPSIIDPGVNGLLVPPGNPDALRDALYNLYMDRPLRRSLAEEGKKTIEVKFSIQDWIGRIENEYLDVLKGRAL